MVCQHDSCIPTRFVDHGINHASRSALRAAHLTPLRTAAGSRHLVDVLPAHTRWSTPDHLCGELDFLPAQYRRERRAANYRPTGSTAAAAGTGGETLTPRR